MIQTTIHDLPPDSDFRFLTTTLRRRQRKDKWASFTTYRYHAQTALRDALSCPTAPSWANHAPQPHPK